MNIFQLILTKALQHKKIIFTLILFIVVFNIVKMIFFNDNSLFNKSKEEEISRDSLGIVTIKSETVEDNINVLGEITFNEKVTVSSKVSGRLEDIWISEGVIVKTDEAIAQIEKLPLELSLRELQDELNITQNSYQLANEKYKNAIKAVDKKIQAIQKTELSLLERKVQFRNSQRVFNNKSELYEINAVSTSEYESARTQYETSFSQYEQTKRELEIQNIGYSDTDIKQAGYSVPSSQQKRTDILRKINTQMEQAEVAAAQSKINQIRSKIESTQILLDETTIRSPIDGIIATKNIESGEMVREDSTITTIFDISKVYIVLNISENDILSIKNDMKISFEVDAIENRKFSANVTNISPFLDPKTRTVQIKAYLENPDNILLPGMFARAQIHLGKRDDVILLSEEALLHYDRDKHTAELVIIKDNTIFKETVETGNEYDSKIEITNGLFEGDEVVTQNIFSVFEGQKVK